MNWILKIIEWFVGLFHKTPVLGPTEDNMGEWYDSRKNEIDPLAFWHPAREAFAEPEKGSFFGAEGATVQARPVATAADLHALEVVNRAGNAYTDRERQYALAVARGEGYYGLGWKTGEGAGSHNWGAVQGQGPAGSFQHLDHHADGTPYTTAFKAYNNDDEGFSDMARILLKPNVKTALKKGSLKEAVMAQHSNGYFELDPTKYLSAVIKNYDRLVTGLPNFPKLLSEKGSGGIGVAVGSFLAALGGFWVTKKMRGG